MTITTEPRLVPAPVFGRTGAAKALGISLAYVNKLIAEGRAVPTVPMDLDGRRVFSLDDLRQLAAALGRDLDGAAGR